MSFLLLIRRYRMAVWLLVTLAVALGVGALTRMPSSIYPELEFPRVVVVAKTGDAPPDVYVATVTRPLEAALSSVLGLERIRSKTIRGATEVSLDFSPGTDMWHALQLVQASVSEARSDLPESMELAIEKVTTGSFPVVTFNLSGPTDPRELRELAELVVKPAFASIPGVGQVDLVGGDEREMEIVLDPDAVTEMGLTASGVATRLEGTMRATAVGRSDEGGRSSTVLADAQPRSPADIGELPIMKSSAGNVVPLSAIAEVVDGHKDRRASVGGPRGETIAISIARLPEASTPDVVERALEIAASLKASLPKGASLRPVYDQAVLVKESIASVRDAILLGVGLCLIVVSLFLRDPRAGLVISLSIPLTLAITFLFMKVFHQTLNLMSLGGMAVAIGLVIDDSIVVVESIAHQRSSGLSAGDAALRGTAELARAVVGTTLTTVVVFVPLAFLEGVIGDFFRSLAFTVVTAVLVSMFVALVLLPLAASAALSKKVRAPKPESRWLEARLRSIASHPIIALVVTALISASAFVLGPRLESGFLPQMDEGGFVIDYFLPIGTTLETTQAAAAKIEAKLGEVPEVANYARRTGAELGPAAATELSRGDIMVRLVDRSMRHRSSREVMAALRTTLEEEVPEMRVEFVEVLKDVLDDLAGNPRPIELKLFGQDPAQLEEAAEKVSERLSGIEGMVDVFDGRERPSKELRFRVDRDALEHLDSTPADVERELEAALLGRVVGQVRRADRFVDVRVRYPDLVRFDPAQTQNLSFATADHVTSFRSVTTLEEISEPSVRYHEALQPVVSVTADHEGRDLGSIGRDIDERIKGLELPPGVRLVMGGQIEAERHTLSSLIQVGAGGILLVLAVLAAQFKRFRLALLVLVSVPMAIVGGMLALVITRTELDASSLMGFVLLIGLVVKNGVLLLEEAERLLDAGETTIDAVTHAARRRLRPILMTTSATIAGLLPLALEMGAGAEIQRPLAIAVLGGLVTSTLATLGVLPPLACLILGKTPKASPSPGEALA